MPTRRDILCRCGTGFGALALADLLAATDVQAAAPDARGPLAPRPAQFPARAQQVVQLFMNGGPSHLDTFDPKPELTKRHGPPLPSQTPRTERKTGAAMGSPFKFQR